MRRFLSFATLLLLLTVFLSFSPADDKPASSEKKDSPAKSAKKPAKEKLRSDRVRGKILQIEATQRIIGIQTELLNTLRRRNNLGQIAYPDVVALAAAAWAAALALRGRPCLAGALGAVAAFARPTGFLIAIPLFLVARGTAARIAAAGAPLAAAVAVHIYFWQRSGDPRAFIHAQQLPIWERNGPSRLSKWPGHVAHAFNVHALLLGCAAVVGIAVVGFVARRFGRWYAAGVAYVFVVAALLLGAQTPQTRIESAVAAVVFPLVGLLWWLGPRYRPWALFATAVVTVSFLSGTVTSFARQALFAFPVYWAVADGPRPLRHPLVAVAAAAANIAFALSLAKYAP